MDINANGQDDASLAESAGFENSYPPEEPGTGDSELLAAAADLSDTHGEDNFGGLSIDSPQADNADQASDGTAFGTTTIPQRWDSQGWDHSDLSVHPEPQPYPWSEPHRAEPAFEDPVADAFAEGATFAADDDNADFWAEASYGGEPLTQETTAVSSAWEANALSWENTGEGTSPQTSIAGGEDLLALAAFPVGGVSETPLGFDNDENDSDDSATWEAFSEWAATDKTDMAGQDFWSADSVPIDAQDGFGDESPQVLQAQLSVEVDSTDTGELASTEEASVTEWFADLGKAGLSGLGLVQELTYPIWKQFEEPQGKPKNFNLSFRDISGFPEPTGQAYINRIDSLTGNPTKWKGLRLDFGPFPDQDSVSGSIKRDPLTGEKMYKVGWHWNQEGSKNAFGIKNHAEIKAGTFAETLGRTLEKAKPLGRAALVGGVFLDAWAMGSAIHTGLHSGEWDPAVVEGARITGGWAGGWAAAQVGGGLGATLGTTMLPGVGTIVGGALGGLAGGAVGYLGGSALGQSAAERATGSPRPQP
ncbi:hypothetical protein [Gloeobacter violaceus]|uniref:Gll1977 protein n=1 Tax=Gloeobacter violaceus (strain ATCC 29082 / PCC 7421) TaxID=251221 RepID=Q7NJ55_GLOVI|nr:hypothetical protein [Gloeobacter violaceus]BAC89918.1 gll1977 [Gloeobacter violaceus PCC 7421]